MPQPTRGELPGYDVLWRWVGRSVLGAMVLFGVEAVAFDLGSNLFDWLWVSTLCGSFFGWVVWLIVRAATNLDLFLDDFRRR